MRLPHHFIRRKGRWLPQAASVSAAHDTSGGDSKVDGHGRTAAPGVSNGSMAGPIENVVRVIPDLLRSISDFNFLCSRIGIVLRLLPEGPLFQRWFGRDLRRDLPDDDGWNGKTPLGLSANAACDCLLVGFTCCGVSGRSVNLSRPLSYFAPAWYCVSRGGDASGSASQTCLSLKY